MSMIQTAAAIGMFDGVHLGHQDLVRQLSQLAKAKGLTSIVITFFEHPLQLIAPDKAPLLLTSDFDKAELLLQAGADTVDITKFDEKLRNQTPREFMQWLKDERGVKLLLIGFNHRIGRNGEGDYEVCKKIGDEIGIEVVQASEAQMPGISSSAIRRAIAEGNIAAANDMLGREYSIRGTVVHGKRIGRTIGFPTANIKPLLDNQLIPKDGVYACQATVDDKSWPAMVNIGDRPTLGVHLKPSIEAHLIGYDGDLYGKEITLRFKERLRGEKLFNSLSDLAAQLEIDKIQTLSFD